MKEGAERSRGKGVEVESAVLDAPSVVSFGAFQVERRLGAGGTSEVVLAYDERTGRAGCPVALKRPLSQAGGVDLVRRFSREARFLHASSHQNVVAAEGVGRVGDTPYLCLEYVEGMDLYRLMQRVEREQRPFPQAAALYIARSVANALMSVHSACSKGGRQLDIVHGDVSPTNILLSCTGEVKLADFGSARALSDLDGDLGREELSSQVAQAVPSGKLGYVSPEQLRGEAVDHRADLFALGVILSELLVGRRMFLGSNRLSVLVAVRDGAVEPLWGARAALPPYLFDVCLRALQLDPTDRHAGAAELSAELCGLCDESAARHELAQWVQWASDSTSVVARLERGVHMVSGERRVVATSPEAQTPSTSIRRPSGEIVTNLSLSNLVDLASRGELGPTDEVSLSGLPFRLASRISELTPYLAASTSAATGQLYDPGVPDFTADLSELPLPEVLSRLRFQRESGHLFVCRERADGGQDRMELLLRDGRVQSMLKEGALESVIVRLRERGELSEEALTEARARHALEGGDLAVLLSERSDVDSSRVLRAVRNQARDHIAAACMWKSGWVMLYRRAEGGEDTLRLDLDLSVVLLVAALTLIRRGDELLEIDQEALVAPASEDGQGASGSGAGIPKLLRALRRHVVRRMTLAELVLLLEQDDSIHIDPSELRAGLSVAVQLGWLTLEAGV